MLLLIDGHNLIGQMPDLRLDDPNDEEELLSRLRAYHASTGFELAVYFDPGLSYRPPVRRSEAGITVYCAPQGHQADELILHEIQHRQDPRQLTVVTSDRVVQQAARARGCRVIDSRAFAAELAHPVRRRRPRTRVRPQVLDVPPLPEKEIDEWLRIFEQGGSQPNPRLRQRR